MCSKRVEKKNNRKGKKTTKEMFICSLKKKKKPTGNAAKGSCISSGRMNIHEDILIHIKAFLWIDVQITHSKSCFIHFLFFIRRMTLGKCVMRDQKGVVFFFFLMSNTCEPALCSVSRESERAAVMNTHTASRGTHRWFNKHGRKLHLSLQLWPWSCDILQHNQYNLRGKREEREGGVDGGWWMVWGGEKVPAPESSLYLD